MKWTVTKLFQNYWLHRLCSKAISTLVVFALQTLAHLLYLPSKHSTWWDLSVKWCHVNSTYKILVLTYLDILFTRDGYRDILLLWYWTEWTNSYLEPWLNFGHAVLVCFFHVGVIGIHQMTSPGSQNSCEIWFLWRILNYEAARKKLVKVCKNLKICPSPYFTCRSYLSIKIDVFLAFSKC